MISDIDALEGDRKYVVCAVATSSSVTNAHSLIFVLYKTGDLTMRLLSLFVLWSQVCSFPPSLPLPPSPPLCAESHLG